MSAFNTINPATNQPIKSYDYTSLAAAKDQLAKTQAAQIVWAKLDSKARGDLFLKLADYMLANKQPFAALMTREMGKLTAAAIAEIEKCAWGSTHFAEFAKNYLADRVIETQLSKSYVTYQPLGVVLAIMPWNYPFWQAFRFAVPAMMAGNAVILKPALNVAECGLTITECFKAVGFPEDIIATLLLDHAELEQLIPDPRISALTVTGSPRAGRAVATAAALGLKKVVLELGGSDPYIVLSDADIEQAAEAIVYSRMNNSGQVCIAAKRVIAVADIAEQLEELILAKLKAYQQNNLGPLAREDLRKNLHEQVLASIAAGAECLCGGVLPDTPGFYYPPTVLKNIPAGTPAYAEELFGPVICLFTVDNTEEAINLANQSIYGLGASIFTQDIAQGERIARDEIQAGSCFVNTFVTSDPRLPFGGIKASGYGRELSEEGIKEFVNIKTIGIK